MSDETPNVPAYTFEGLLQLVGYATKTMLRRERRQVADGQQPVGQYWSGHDWVLLYREADAVDMPPMSPGRQRLYEKNRTCARCGATRAETFPKGRDGERYCGTCQLPAAKALWQHERAGDRPVIAEWARGVLADPNVVYGALTRLHKFQRQLVVGQDGAVLLDANVRYYARERDPEIAQMSPLAIVEQAKALRGRRLIGWDSWSVPSLTTSFDDFGNPAMHATQVAQDDAFGSWYTRWVGKASGSLLQNPWLMPQRMPGDAAECIAAIRTTLTEMASLASGDTAPNSASGGGA